jgi:hypothetical protein
MLLYLSESSPARDIIRLDNISFIFKNGIGIRIKLG